MQNNFPDTAEMMFLQGPPTNVIQRISPRPRPNTKRLYSGACTSCRWDGRSAGGGSSGAASGQGPGTELGAMTAHFLQAYVDWHEPLVRFMMMKNQRSR